ncbi:MAG: DUF5915 domain-containing protein, partial [Candidatus Heimdallarchaeota archaeon]
ATIHQCLTVLMRLIAPFVPFFSDQIYQNLMQKESVHLESWPIVRKEDLSDALTQRMELVRQVVEKGHAIRKENKIKVRQPLSSIKYQISSVKLEKELEELIKQELNVKSVEYEKNDGELEVSLNLSMTEELKNEGVAREVIRLIQKLRKELGCKFSEHISVYYQATDNISDVIQKFDDEIKRQVLATKIEKTKKDLETTLNKKIGGNDVWIGIELVV